MTRTIAGLVLSLLLLPTVSQAQTLKELRTFRAHKGWVGGVAFSPDGKLCATAGSDGTAALWDVATGERKTVFEGHSDHVCAVAFVPDGNILVTGSHDKSAKVWDVASGKLLHTLTGHRGAVQCVAISPDSRTIATGSLDATVRLWDAHAGKELGVLVGHRTWVNGVAFPRNDRLVTGSSDGAVAMWDVPSRRWEFSHTMPREAGEVRSIAVSPDGMRVAAGMRYGQLVVTSFSQKGVAHTIAKAHQADVWGVAYSGDGSLLASGNGDWDRPGSVKVWDAQHKLVAELKHTGEVLCVAFAPQGNLLAAGSWDGNVRVWTYSKTAD